MSHKKRIQYLAWGILGIAILLHYVGVAWLGHWHKSQINKIATSHFILVDKASMTLTLYDYNGDSIKSFGVTTGKGYGNKAVVGDMKTPEGVFHVQQIQESKDWEHDFNDGNGTVIGSYGPYFIRLAVPGHRGIGIHGTHRPERIGTRDSEGCIRLKNEDLEELVPFVRPGMVVVITPDASDVATDLL